MLGRNFRKIIEKKLPNDDTEYKLDGKKLNTFPQIASKINDFQFQNQQEGPDQIQNKLDEIWEDFYGK